MKKFFNLRVLFLIFVTLLFFNPFFFQGKLPIPSDTIIGLYHPFRDLYSKDYPNGIPFKNFLITDPVRQQFPWKFLVTEVEKRAELPLWNPYNFAGSPLLANFQSGVFYPLNILFFILPFHLGWSILIILQPLLAMVFMYMFLRLLRLSIGASILGGISFAFCGFFVSWMEWGNVVSTGLWLPLVFISIDKLILGIKYKVLSIQKNLFWYFIFIFSLSSSFFAGHLQIFFYVFVVSFLYFLAKWIQFGKQKKILLTFLLLASCFLLLTAVQWLPTLQFINLSARNIDQLDWQQIEGWFIPWQHLIQFIAPDFFGNPTTLNYWGTWNYGEHVGYIGIIPLIFSLFALIYRRDKKTLFFGLIFLLSFAFSLPTVLAKLPYILDIPFLSTSQPTRLIFLADFSLTILAALGFDFYSKEFGKRKIFIPLIFIIFIFVGLWIFILQNSGENISVAKRNLYLPTILFITAWIIITVNFLTKNKLIHNILIGTLVAVTIFDVFRFSQKFTPFTSKEYLFPQTKILEFLQKKSDNFRIMTTDSRILPPNFALIYHLQSVDGYDPLYLRRYGELIATSERDKPDINHPFGFNRIITPHNIDSHIINLLGVKYILSFTKLPAPQFTKVFEEGQTKVYENNEVSPRAYFVTKVKYAKDEQEAINILFDRTIDLKNTAVLEEPLKNVRSDKFEMGDVAIIDYSENRIIIQTKNKKEGFLVLTDSFYPTWHAKICSSDEQNCQTTDIYLTNYNFRGIIVPSGEHSIVFYNTLL